MELKTLGKFFKIWYPSILMMVLIFIMSSFSAPASDEQSGLIVNAITTAFPDLENVSPLVTIVRKTAHFIEYAVLGFFTARSFFLSNKSFVIAIPFCIFYAALDEFHQTFVPGRSGEISDAFLDSFGASFGIFIFWFSHRKKLKK